MNCEGLVLVSYGNQGVVETTDGSILDCHYRRSVGRPYCGDRVMIEMEGDRPQVIDILPRVNVFARADNRQRRLIRDSFSKDLLTVAMPGDEA